jgi:hypothetical protein
MFRRFVAQLSMWVHRSGDSGQTTAEYALVILGAVALATLFIAWATGSHAVSKLFDSVISKVLPG